MKIIQSHRKFYVELSADEIIICPKSGICSSYPVWLGKNRAIMREVIQFFEKHPPQTLHDCLDIVGHFELNGMGTPEKRQDNLFEEKSESLDEDKIFW